MARVAFINENTLGHRSYLEPYAQSLKGMPNNCFDIDWHDVIPLPADLAWFGETSIRGLRRWGLDLGATRWRMAASQHALRLVRQAHSRRPYDAIVVNTQSVALSFARWRGCPPLLVCMDATFRQLAKTPWFASGTIGRCAAPLMLAWLFKREIQLFQKAKYLLPWSEAAARSLRDDYGIPTQKIHIVPPSVNIQPFQKKIRPIGQKRQILFIGGDFKRKGGPILLQAFRSYLRADWELHIVTQSDVQEEPGVKVYRGVTHGSVAWLERWQHADVFVFPSSLETFGIVLLEAIAFGIPVISSKAGAAIEILNDGKAGILLDEISPDSIVIALNSIIEKPYHTKVRVENGLDSAVNRYNVFANAVILSKLIHMFSNRDVAI